MSEHGDARLVIVIGAAATWQDLLDTGETTWDPQAVQALATEMIEGADTTSPYDWVAGYLTAAAHCDDLDAASVFATGMALAYHLTRGDFDLDGPDE